MTCGRFRDHLPDLLGDELNPVERAELECHARQCANCRAEFEELRLAAESVRALRPDDVLTTAGASRVSLPALPHRRWRAAGAIMRYAAVIAFAFVGGYLARGAFPTEMANNHASGNPAPVASSTTPTIHPRIAQNYQRAADQHPNASTLGLSLLSIARR